MRGTDTDSIDSLGPVVFPVHSHSSSVRALRRGRGERGGRPYLPSLLLDVDRK